MNAIRTHGDVALYCLAHLRQKGNDGSDNLLFIGLLTQALAAQQCSDSDTPRVVVTPAEIRRHEKKGYFARAKYLLGILRSGTSRYNASLVEQLLENVAHAETTLKNLKTSMDELVSFL